MAAKKKTAKKGTKAKPAKAPKTTGSPLQDGIRAELGAAATFLANGSAVDFAGVPTTSLDLNAALGGGMPLGRIVELFGKESSGKTTLSLDVVVNAQRKYPGRECLYVDVENALDPRWASAKIGVDLAHMPIAQPDSAEGAVDLITFALKMPKPPVVIVLDSVAGLVTEKELEHGASDLTTAAVAALLSRTLKKWTSLAKEAHCLVVLVNQERANIKFGRPGGSTTTGGNALKYYASQRTQLFGVKIRQGGKADEDDTRNIPVVGLESRATVVKNKMAPPFGRAEFRIWFDRGIDPLVELLMFGLKIGVVALAGSWVRLLDPTHPRAKDGVVPLGQGLNNACANLHNDPELQAHVRALVLAAGV